jgi:hypothetical protein
VVNILSASVNVVVVNSSLMSIRLGPYPSSDCSGQYHSITLAVRGSVMVSTFPYNDSVFVPFKDDPIFISNCVDNSNVLVESSVITTNTTAFRTGGSNSNLSLTLRALFVSKIYNGPQNGGKDIKPLPGAVTSLFWINSNVSNFTLAVEDCVIHWFASYMYSSRLLECSNLNFRATLMFRNVSAVSTSYGPYVDVTYMSVESLGDQSLLAITDSSFTIHGGNTIYFISFRSAASSRASVLICRTSIQSLAYYPREEYPVHDLVTAL